MVYDGHVRSLGILSYSVFVTNSVAGSFELPADMVPVLTLDRLGRRWTLFFSMGLSGIVSIATGLTPVTHTLAIAIMALAGRFFITIAMNTGVQYTVELVPTQLRGQGVGIVHITGHCATFFAPFILYLVGIFLCFFKYCAAYRHLLILFLNEQSTYSSTLPYLVLGAFSLLGGLICLMLPETALENLPESVAEAEKFGTAQSCFYMPCISK